MWLSAGFGDSHPVRLLRRPGRKAGLATVLIGLSLALLAACSDSTAEQLAASGSAPSSPATATSAATQPSTDTSGWPVYSSSKWGYRIKYPVGWYDLSNGGAPDTDKYFANQNVGTPLEMTSGGVYAVVRVSEDPWPSCAEANLQFGSVLRQADIRTAGATVTRYVLDNQPWVVMNLENRGTCYELFFIIYQPETRDKNLSLMDAILSSFEFTSK